MKRMSMIIASLIVVLAIVIGLASLLAPIQETQTSAQTLARANQLYENGQAQDAAQLYTQLINQGINSSIVYFNLGNALMQNGDYAKAIAAYEQAKTLEPRDEAISANLERAHTQLSNVPPSPDFVEMALNFFSVNELAAGTLILWTVVIVGVVLMRQQLPGGIGHVLKPVTIIASTLLIVCLALLGGQLSTNDTETINQITPPAQQVDDLANNATP